MINRTTKLTALLVAAASIASMTPVMAVEKLGNREGTIKEAIAFEGGKYVYEGYRTDDDDTGIWYNKGTEKDTFLEDLEEYEITAGAKYGTKYLNVSEDGNKDEYLVDLTTGKIIDDESASEKEDSSKSKLVSNLKKAERYNSVSDSKIQSEDVETNRLFKNQFGEVWHQYITTTDSQVELNDTTGAAILTDGASFGKDSYTGFFNENGKYIDASYTANLKIYNPRKGKATLIEKYDKVYKDEALKVNLKAVKPLAQDKDSIYVLSTVEVVYYHVMEDGKKVYKYADGAIEEKTTQYFVQKISKAQGEKTDGAYLPKSVVSYQLDGEDAQDTMFKNDDADDAFNAIMKYETLGEDVLYSVKDGKLYVTYVEKDGNKDKVHTHKLKLGKMKEDVVNTSIRGEKYEDIDISVVLQEDDGDQEVQNKAKSVSIDIDGNTWAINKGKIMMFDGSEFKDVYSCDRSFNTIDVYNNGSLVAWEEGGDSYTTVQEGKNQTVNDATEIDPDLGKDNNTNTTKTGWDQQADGTWVLYDTVGNKVTGWANIGGAWYYMNTNGIMQTGWINDNGTWYFLNPVSDGTKGAMKTGWLYDNGAWYYLNASGAMQTGWLNDNGTWYYLNANGSMAANTTVGGYKLGANGAWIR